MEGTLPLPRIRSTFPVSLTHPPPPGPSVDAGHVVGTTTASRNALHASPTCIPATVRAICACACMYFFTRARTRTCPCVRGVHTRAMWDKRVERGAAAPSSALSSPSSLLTCFANRFAGNSSCFLSVSLGFSRVSSGDGGKGDFGRGRSLFQEIFGCVLRED